MSLLERGQGDFLDEGKPPAAPRQASRCLGRWGGERNIAS